MQPAFPLVDSTESREWYRQYSLCKKCTNPSYLLSQSSKSTYCSIVREAAQSAEKATIKRATTADPLSHPEPSLVDGKWVREGRGR